MHFAIVVPCYNEARRLQPEGFLPLLADERWRLVLVNDGSTDETLDVLERLRSRGPDRIEVLNLSSNVGKSEAVRLGLLHAIAGGAGAVGYLDADLATPADELFRIFAALEDPTVQMALGSRVMLLGRDVRRSHTRHLLGRVFATLTSLTLEMPVYDTQCGAKALRVTPMLEGALQTPWGSRWIFDVELIARLRSAGVGVGGFVEVPLMRWHDIPGSKLSVAAMTRSLVDLARLAAKLRRGPSR